MGISIKPINFNSDEECIAYLKACMGNKCTSELGSMN